MLSVEISGLNVLQMLSRKLPELLSQTEDRNTADRVYMNIPGIHTFRASSLFALSEQTSVPRLPTFCLLIKNKRKKPWRCVDR